MTTLLLVGVATFILIGFGQVDFSLLSPQANPDFASQGNLGIFKAACLLSFATYAQYYLMYFSKYAKNPKKDIPFAMIGTTATIFIIYLGVSVVASGVLPIDEVANQPMTLVAREVLSTPLFVFFMICGPFMALSTTINSVMMVSIAMLPSKFPHAWAKREFGKKVPLWAFYTLVGLAGVVQGILIYNSITSIKLYIVLVTGLAFVAGIIYAIRKDKEINVESPKIATTI